MCERIPIKFNFQLLSYDEKIKKIIEEKEKGDALLKEYFQLKKLRDSDEQNILRSKLNKSY